MPLLAGSTLSIYTSSGSLVSFDAETGRIMHRPAGVASNGLGLDRGEGAACLLDVQPFGARRLEVEPDGSDRLRVSPTSTLHEVTRSLEVVPAAGGRVTLRWAGTFLTADLAGGITLAPTPHPEFSSFWLLQPGPAFEAPVFLLQRADCIEAAVNDFLPNLGFPQIEHLIDRLVSVGLYGSALNLMFHIIDSNYFLPPFHGRSLFVPELDRQLLRISDALLRDIRPDFRPAMPGRRLIIASELYMSGGHSRVIEDLARSSLKTKIIVTDCFGNVAAGRFGLGFLTQRLPDVEIVFMKRATLEHKARALLTAVAQHGPAEIFLLGHHQDPTLPAALASEDIPYRRIFLHHTDNNICLGATSRTFVFVNFTKYHAEVVSAVRGIKTCYLPLCVDDLGPKPNFERVDRIRSTVTSGGQDKYSRSGTLPYADVVRTILSAIPGDHFHIGPLPTDWVDEIRRALDEAEIDSGRFRYLGVVPSLWRALLDIDAQLYIASAPNGGARASIEAQGAGYPVLFYANPTNPVLMQVDEFNADTSLSWKDTGELGQSLLAMGEDIPSQSRRARRFYEESFSGEAFAENVRRLGATAGPMNEDFDDRKSI
ncbi:hypothetical protein D3273_20985 [Lichenibacterium minor]|uniref:Uncharacterized protein n=1 Tax=Lichenibacterium minor TaxID=2316528 RepID=A0A4Q2U165_9HYPH|nr:hypothetical protein [Lichenibacterium minor]RYC30012.1 hypothetical protein D3273_20985 [Lichenibacterium minor]